MKKTCFFCIVFFSASFGSGFVERLIAAEYNVSASSGWSYLLFAQAGRHGFFGQYDQDNSSTPGTYASANAWLGSQVNGLSSGGGASRGLSTTTFFLHAAANRAIWLHGAYQIGGGDWAWYPGATVSNAVGQWSNLFVTVDCPIGLVSYGKRSFDFGIGLQYSLANRSEEYFAIVSEYGPFQFGLGAYPWRLGDKIIQVRTPYWNSADWGGLRKDVFGFIKYQTGPMEFGVGTIFANVSQGPESQRVQALRESFSQRNTDVSEGFIYMKYFNSRLFLNAEADWHYRTDKYRPSLNGKFNTTSERQDGSGSVFRPTYVESWRYAVEGGVILGPAMISVLFAHVPGPDRRHGIYHDTQTVVVDPDVKFNDVLLWDPDLGNGSLFGPYSLLLATSFGSGVGAYNRNGTGQMVDANVLACRINYAVASNLNLGGSFLYATRASRSGYGWGYIQPGQDLVPVLLSDNGAFDPSVPASSGVVQYGVLRRFDQNLTQPNIPDDSLGWEVDFTLDWALLQGWNLSMIGAFWQPGRWFNYACIDRAIPDWDKVSLGSFPIPPNWGINPNRIIDPVYGITINLSVGL